MKCGAKRFLADIEIKDEIKIVPVTARTPVAARKVIRTKFGTHVHIIAIRLENLAIAKVNTPIGERQR